MAKGKGYSGTKASTGYKGSANYKGGGSPSIKSRASNKYMPSVKLNKYGNPSKNRLENGLLSNSKPLYENNGNKVAIFYQKDAKGNETLIINYQTPKGGDGESILKGVEKLVSSYLQKNDSFDKNLFTSFLEGAYGKESDEEELDGAKLGRCSQCGIPMVGEGICPRCLVTSSYSLN